MRDLSNILIWKQSFGLLPIHLKPTKKESSFVMLNGGSGDFCLQTIKDKSDKNDYFSKSWSSNTKNFVVLNKDKVEVYNWLKEKPESISQTQVAENFEKFYTYLLSKSHKSDNDVVPFIISIFRQFRNLTFEKTNPIEALNLLFILLTSLEDGNSKLDAGKWNINKTTIPDNFEYYTQMLNNGINNIKPEFDIIIRHSAGALFQEAQKEVLFFNSQTDLFGGISNKLETKNNLYSSIHYTPPYLSRTIVENSIKLLDLKKDKIKIFDPACGSSEFLIEVLKQLNELNYKGKLEIIGWDSSETAVNTSNFLLKYEQRTVWNDKLKFKIKLVEDSLKEQWDNDYDLILMNPPFISWELLSNKEAKEAIRDTLGSNFNGKPNQASAFFYKSIRCLSPSGVIGCVVPSSLLTLDAYKQLRVEASDLITINLIGKLGNFIFEDALTDVSIIIGHKPKTNQVPTILWTKNEKGIAQDALRDYRKMVYSNEFTINEEDYTIFKPISFPIIPDSWKTISLKENDLLKKIERFVSENKLLRIGDIFNVQQGIRTGNNNVFKISKLEYGKLPAKERKFFRPIVDNDAIKNGKLSVNNYVWFPYDTQKGDSIINTQKELISKVPYFFNHHLSQYKPDLANRKKQVQFWWSLSDRAPRLLPLKPVIVSTEFGRSDSFAFDKDGLFTVERGNAWLPTLKYQKDFKNLDYYYFYLAILSAPFFDKLLSIYSKQLAGGNWYDLGKKYTNQIPIPEVYKGKNLSNDLNKIHVESPIFKKLVDFGKDISSGEFFNKDVLNKFVKKYIYQID